MAERLRRAARHYEVHEFDEGPLRPRLGVRAHCASYEEAVDFALGYVDERHPVELEVVRVEDGGNEVVWSYDVGRAPFSSGDLVRLWGFDVTRPWHGPPSAGPLS
jgi:hypothetical protein